MKNPKYLDKAFEAVCLELLTMFIKKHQDYGKGNILEMKELGIAFRIGEKINRIKNLLMTKKSRFMNQSKKIGLMWPSMQSLPFYTKEAGFRS